MHITISGPRDVQRDRVFKPHFFHTMFTRYLEPFADSRFYIGGARGTDTMALIWLMKNTICHIEVVVPFELSDQPAEARRAVMQCVRSRAFGKRITVTQLQMKGWGSRAHHIRNEYMIDRSELLIAFPFSPIEEERSGTWSAVRYAERIGRPHMIVPITSVADNV